MTAPLGQRQYPCEACGANVEFVPGTTVLRCPYCQHETALHDGGRDVREHDIAELAQPGRRAVATLDAHVFTCQRCGAQTRSEAVSEQCQFCGAPMVADVSAGEQVAPEAVLPFTIDNAAVRQRLRAWIRSRWFAPSSLKKVSAAESTRSMYLPHWTYDARTASRYHGERGEHYHETEQYTETVNGATVTKTRQVRRTRWYPASGEVRRDFDDILVTGTTKVTTKHLDALEPWPLTDAEPYRPEYLAGHRTLRYDVEPEAGLQAAKEQMAPVIRRDCMHDIGGDEQRVHSVHTSYSDVMFKLMLLPVWIACYLHAGKTYTVLVNGRTGEIAGERPYSPSKIIAFIAAVVAAVTALILLYVNLKH